MAESLLAQGARMADESGTNDHEEKVIHINRPRRPIAGAVLLVLGLLFLLDNLMPGLAITRFWPVLLIAIGIMLLFKGSR